MQISQLHYKPAGPRALQTIIKGGKRTECLELDGPTSTHSFSTDAYGKTIMGYLAVRRPDIANK